MDLSSRIQNFFNSKKKQLGQAIQQAPQQLQSFGKQIVSNVRNQPLLSVNKPSLDLFANFKPQKRVAVPNSPTVGQAYDNMIKPSINTIKEGAKAYSRLSPQGQMLKRYAPQSDLAARPGLMNNLKDTWSVGKAGATIVGANRITPALIGTSALLGGGLNKVFGGSFTEGAMAGVGQSPVLAGIGSVTNPLINKFSTGIASNVSNPVSKFLVNRGVTGALNIPEGIAMKGALTPNPYGVADAAMDFGMGALTGSNRQMIGKGMVMKKEYPNIIPKIEENIKDIIVRYAKTFGEAADPQNPNVDLNIEDDAVQIWKTIYGNEPIPKGFNGINLDRVIGDIKEGYNGWKTEMNMAGQGLRMGIKNDKPQVAKQSFYDTPKVLYRGVKKGYPNSGSVSGTWLTSDYKTAQKYAGEGGKVIGVDVTPELQAKFKDAGIRTEDGIKQYQARLGMNDAIKELENPRVAQESLPNQSFYDTGKAPKIDLQYYPYKFKDTSMPGYSESGLTRGIFKDGKNIGGVDFFPDGSEPGTFVINNIEIKPNVRGQGVGREAINQVFDQTKAKKLIGYADNPDSVAFWKKLGAKVDENNMFSLDNPRVAQESKADTGLVSPRIADLKRQMMDIIQNGKREGNELALQERARVDQIAQQIRQLESETVGMGNAQLGNRGDIPENVMKFAETPGVSNELRNALQAAESAEDEALIIKEFTEIALRNAKGNSLKATRAALNQELQGIVGSQGNYKANYAALQQLKNDPNTAPRIDAIEDAIIKIDKAIREPITPKEMVKPDIISQARPGDISNVRSGDPRIASTFKKEQLMKESGITPAKLPPEFKRSQDNSVIDEIKQGFAGGRNAREQANKVNKGTLGQRARSELVDRFSSVYDFVKGKNLKAEDDPYKRMRLLAGTSGKIEAFIENNVSPVLKREQKRLSDLGAMLVMDRERELIGRGLQRKRTIEQLDQGNAELIAKYGNEGYQTLRQSADEMRKVGNQLLEQLKESGIIDDESYKVIKNNNEFYTPFEAVEHIADNLEKGNFGTGSFNVASQDVIKRIGDYMGDVADPIESLVRKIPKVISLVEKNKAIQSLTKLREIDPDNFGAMIQPIKGEGVPAGMGVVNVFENGKNVRYAVPEVIERAVKNLDGETGGILLTLGSIQAKMLRTGATALNIGFIPVNIVRDVQDAMTTEITEKGVKGMLSFLASYPRAIYAAAKRDDLYKLWMQEGGAQSTMTEQIFKKTPKTVAQLAGKKPKLLNRLNPITNTKNLIEFANRVGEQSTRLARFSSGLKRGESMTEAAFKSRDISLDFAKAGNSIKVLNQVIPFLNAGIQGSEKLMRLYKNNPKAAIASTSVMFGIPTVALFSHNSQFKDYDDIPDAEKQTNWVILARDRTQEEIANGDSPIGIKIPKGFIGRMVSTTTESAMQFMKSKDPSTFPKAGLDVAASLSPVGLPYNEEQLGQSLSTVLPPWIKAGVEWTTNTNLFFGSKIVPQSLENMPAAEQYKEKTPAVYKMAGKLTGQSPLKIQNTVNTTTGGVGRQIATLLSGDLKGGTTEQVSRRFMDIRDGKKADEAYDTVNKEKEYTALRNKQLKEAFRENDMKEFERLSEGMTSQQIKSLITNDFKKQQKEELTPEQKAYESLTGEEQRRLGEKRPELKTELDIVPKVGAASEDPYDFEASIKNDAKEAVVKARVEMSGKPEEFNDKYFYINENGNPASISMDFTVEKPELSGDAALDKKLKSKYQSKLSTIEGNIIELYELGKFTKEEAVVELQKLKEARSTGGGSGGGKKGAKIDYRQFAKVVKPVKVTVSKSRSKPYKAPTVKAPSVKQPSLKQLKYKGKVMSLRKKK